MRSKRSLYIILITPSAEKDMNKLTGEIRNKLSKKILSLEDNPRPRGIKKLSELDEYRLRFGDYRLLFTIDDKNKEVIIVAVGHRKDVYR